MAIGQERFGPAVVEMAHIHKSFKEVHALVDVPFTLRAGEVRALVGENGAGKSTLMNILFGMYSFDSGLMKIFGKPVEGKWTSINAIHSGIGMIHQHFSSVACFTVLENVMLPALTWKDLKRDWATESVKIKQIIAEYNFELNINDCVETLSVGQKQQLEILKALYLGAKILILDEPTGVLTPQQAENLLNFLLVLKAKGLSVVMVTHKLEEALQVCDSISVLRAGRHVGTVLKEDTNLQDLARMMIERDYIVTTEGHQPVQGRKPVLEVKDLSVKNEGGTYALDHATFTLYEGEILGVAGVSGNGQTELAEALVGLTQPSEGTVSLEGRCIDRQSIKERRLNGLGYIPEDRHRTGLVLPMSIAENIILDRLTEPPFAKGLMARHQVISEFANQAIREYRIKTPHEKVPAGNLSGGNQQKVVLARTISARPKVIIACQPTWGLDFGATDYVRERLLQAAENEAGVLLISSDLDELLELSNRILVICHGRIMGCLDRDKIDIEQLGMMMVGSAAANQACGA